MNPKNISAAGLVVLVLAVILAAFILAGPATGLVSPYKKVDRAYVLNPNVGEKVQFDGVYVARTTWGNGDVLYYVPPENYDVISVDGGYVFLSDPYYSNNLTGKFAKTIHAEGAFTDSSMKIQPTPNGTYAGYIFKADRIEVL